MREHQHIVVAYDFSQSSMAALERAVDLATRSPGDVLHFCCVIEGHNAIPAIPADNGDVDAAYAQKVQEAVFTEVELQLALAQTDARVDFFVHVRMGKPSEEILDLAREIGADAIIVGSKRLRGIERMLVGSVSEKIVRKAGCTVEVARPKAYRDVAFTPVVEVEPDHTPYVPPHRYTYDDHRVEMRPNDWPLY